MANSKAVWGIDIGQCGLKALRCVPGPDGESVVAEAYDYIEYPKILSSPDADPEILVAEALEQFISRNELVGDAVAVAVPGQAGLSRFFKPPPVDAKTLPDIVKYEVKQQIPFPLEDVIWDWQRLGGTVVDDVTVDAEVGLFAMKREAVFRALKPFTDKDIEVDIVQLAPLATFNVVCNDILENIPDPAEVDMDNPPESLVVLSIGTDTTDLIITNGIKLWLRNIPIGGNHFTKQLARELKLTTNKAELLKRNARQAEDPKTVFQAMRSVFNDLVTEIQRSLSYFQGLEKNAKIKRIALMGNAAKLPGLRQFLNKQLDLDIIKVSGYRNLTGDSVIKQKSFEGNILTFAPCYGLCLQGLNKAHLDTNLLPQEFITERMIRAKKPWTLAAVTLLMLGMTVCFLMYINKWSKVQPDYKEGNLTWASVTSKVDTAKNQSNNLTQTDARLKTELDRVNRVSKELSGSLDNKGTWIELLSAFHQVLPKDPRISGNVVDARQVPFRDRSEIYITYVESEFFENIVDWKKSVQPYYDAQLAEMPNLVAELEAKKPTTGAATTNANKKETGWVVEFGAYHFMNSEDVQRARQGDITFVREKLIKKMLTDTIEIPGIDLPKPEDGQPAKKLTLADIGVIMPTVVQEADRPIVTVIEVTDLGKKDDANTAAERPGETKSAGQDESEDKSSDETGDETAGTEDETTEPKVEEQTAGARQTVRRFNFVVQFAWTPRSPQEILDAYNKRIAAEKKAEEEKAKTAAQANQNNQN